MSVKDQVQNLQCECAAQAGTYASVADCRSDIFKLEPLGDAQCMRELFAANPLEAPMLDCNLTELENLASCLAGASCNEDLTLACLGDFDQRLTACPTGPGTLGDSFGFDSSDAVAMSAPGIPELRFTAATAIFTDQSFYPGTSILPFSNLPTFTDADIGSLEGGTLTDGAESYNFDVTSFTVSVDPLFSFLLNYTASGTLTDSSGVDVATLVINVQNESHDPPDTTITEPGFKRMEWSADASYEINLPGAPVPPIAFSGSTKLVAYDSFFDAALESCQDLPGDQLAAVFGDSLDASIDELCRCSEDETVRAQCLLAKQDFRSDCLAQIVDLDPIAAEVTECLVEQLDTDTELMSGQACCANPGDVDCLSSGPFSGSLGAGLEVAQCLPSDEARGFADAILACLRPPPLVIDFSDDPARCDNETSLASGEAGYFMVVTRSRKLDPNDVPYSRHYLILDLTQLSALATIPVDAVQQFLFSLFLLDADTSPGATDQCERPNIVSIALDDADATANFIAVSDNIRFVQEGLVALPDEIAGGFTDIEAYVEQLYENEICPTFDEIIDAGLTEADFPLDILLKKVLLGRLGC